MAKAYLKTTESDTQYWCNNCDEWDDEDNFWSGTFYQGCGSCYELDGEDWYDDYASVTFWVHSGCDYNAANQGSTPDSRTETEMWVCGECKSEYEEQEEARECCL
jgi:hypothetical protein